MIQKTPISHNGGFVITSIIPNKMMHVNLIEFYKCGVRSAKLPAGINFFTKTDEELFVPYNKMEEFLIAVVESYVRFDEQFSKANYMVTVKIEKQ
jgi:hypothetical protein